MTCCQYELGTDSNCDWDVMELGLMPSTGPSSLSALELDLLELDRSRAEAEAVKASKNTDSMFFVHRKSESVWGSGCREGELGSQ